MQPLLNFISSLRLTVVLLALSLVVTFVGTLAQVKLGLYVAQEQYFRSVFVYWGPEGSGWRIPVLPGGWLLGGLLLINLLAAHAKRFTLTRKKAGIFLIHLGLIILLIGQFVTETSQVESVMNFLPGESKNYSESQMANELVLIDKSDPASDRVVSIPQSLLAPGKEITDARLPFTLRVKDYSVNSVPVRGGKADDGRMTAPNGIGEKMQLSKLPFTAKMDEQNLPAATVEVVAAGQPLGTWLVSPWASDRRLVAGVVRNFGPQYAGMSAPQEFTHDGKTWQIALRFKRHYKDHSITLLRADHDKYRGTEIPKNFSSQVRVENPKTSEKREVRIYMNNPLRYAGETYYQYQMGEDEMGRHDGSSTLQVVRNPVWLTPYLSCTLVSLGLVVQFLMHLVDFGKRISQKRQPPGASDSGKPGRAEKKPAKGKAARREPEPVAAKLKPQP